MRHTKLDVVRWFYMDHINDHIITFVSASVTTLGVVLVLRATGLIS